MKPGSHDPFSVSNVLGALHDLDADKGPGSDGIPPRFFKLTATAIAGPLTTIFNRSLVTGTFSALCKEAHVVAVHKSALRSRIENYPVDHKRILSYYYP